MKSWYAGLFALTSLRAKPSARLRPELSGFPVFEETIDGFH